MLVFRLKAMPKNEQPVIMHFNPWLFSGHNELIITFFNQLLVVLGKGNWTRDLKKKMAKFADILSESHLPYTSSAKLLARLLHSEQESISEIKTKISELLFKQEEKLVVIIDDIDRLTVEEIRETFRLIKSVADFPNVVYLLAFAKEIVVRSLDGFQGNSGDAYLEKIVQLPLKLPPMYKIKLREIFYNQLEWILDATPEDLFDKNYLNNIYFYGIDHFIETPRDVIRLTNILNATYSPVHLEVNPVDFIAIGALQVYCPSVYDIIRNNEEAFTISHDLFSRYYSEKLNEFHNQWMRQIKEEDHEAIKHILTVIFPKLRSLWGNDILNVEHESKLCKHLGVRNRENFFTYFRLTPPADHISNIDMMAMISLAEDPNIFAAKLVELANTKRPDGTSKIKEFLEKLENYTEDYICNDLIPRILQSLFDVGDELLLYDNGYVKAFDYGIDMRIMRITRQLLNPLDEAKRFEILEMFISEGKAISIISKEILILGQEHGKYLEMDDHYIPEKSVSSEHFVHLENIALGRIKEASEDGSLLKIPNLWDVLYLWRNLDDPSNVEHWAQKITRDDVGLTMFLEKLLQRNDRLDPRSIKLFINPSQIIDRARRIALNERITNNQRKALKQFIKEYEILDDGKDPNDPWVWSTWKG